MRSRSSLAWIFVLGCTSGAAGLAACGSGDGSSAFDSGPTQGAGGNNGGGGSTDVGGNFIGSGGSGHQQIKSLEVTPATKTLDVQSGGTAAQHFKAIAHYKDGSSSTVSATWSADALAVGSIDGDGTFTASGGQGGVVTVTAKVGSASANAKLTVVLHVSDNPAGADAATKAALRGATTADAAVVWAYPYDKTVFPRGIGAPLLMWNNGGAADVYYVHVTSGTFELESFTNAAPPSQYAFDAAVWDAFANSTSGKAELEVARWDGTSATVVVDQHYTIAPGTMHGTIYYWAINKGRVMRITPGAAAPDDFLGAGVPCPSCHTVSADGSNLVMNTSRPPGDTWPDEQSVSYDLVGQTNNFAGLQTSGASPYALSGVSADGKHLLLNFAPLRGSIAQGGNEGVYDAATATKIAGTGIDSLAAWMPAFSPDNELVAYVTGNAGDLHALDWNGTPSPPQGSNDRLITSAGGDGNTKFINNPSVSPDHKWIIYQRSPGYGSLGIAGNLYLASVDNPGTEIPLDALNGKTYPFAAGDRDRDLSFEPTFAPVASGGYFWVVFHTRRTWGNELTDQAYCGEGCGTKQLWVAAIDQNPTAGTDPSHPAFHLPGQDTTTRNMRGYWALPPCKADGKSCESGTDCCGGYCDTTGDAGGGVCKSHSGGGCSQEGDKCDTASDCCSHPSACINHHCANNPPH